MLKPLEKTRKMSEIPSFTGQRHSLFEKNFEIDEIICYTMIGFVYENLSKRKYKATGGYGE